MKQIARSLLVISGLSKHIDQCWVGNATFHKIKKNCCGGIPNQQWCFQSLECQMYPQHSLTWLQFINCWTLPKAQNRPNNHPSPEIHTERQHRRLSICTYLKKQVAVVYGSMTPDTLRPLDCTSDFSLTPGSTPDWAPRRSTR